MVPSIKGPCFAWPHQTARVTTMIRNKDTKVDLRSSMLPYQSIKGFENLNAGLVNGNNHCAPIPGCVFHCPYYHSCSPRIQPCTCHGIIQIVQALKSDIKKAVELERPHLRWAHP